MLVHLHQNILSTLCNQHEMPRSLVIYHCEGCIFITRNKKDYTRHLNSQKHLQNYPPPPPPPAPPDTTPAPTPAPKKPTVCVHCNKVFKSRTSIYTHRNSCRGENGENGGVTSEQIQMILTENKRMKEILGIE